MIVPGAVCVPLGRLYVGPEQVAASYTVQKDIEFRQQSVNVRPPHVRVVRHSPATGPGQTLGAAPG